MAEHTNHSRLIDNFGREVNYLRISVTDRCDFRCVYCMAEEMTFLPREQILSLEEIYTIARKFVQLGVSKLRITGGEPLVRRGIVELLERLARLEGLRELVMTTNGSQLHRLAGPIHDAGVSRLNISLDTLDPEKFRVLTRTGDLQKVLQGIEAARSQGFRRLKLNSVILKGRNEQEILPLVEFAMEKGLDISFIEEMPLGEVSDHDRAEAYYSSDAIRADIEQRYSLVASAEATGGPSDYFRIPGSNTRVGFISPHSHNFCGTCNRVRLTVEGRLLLCLGNEHSVDLKQVVRSDNATEESLEHCIRNAMRIKPEKHEFNLEAKPLIFRYMNTTGG